MGATLRDWKPWPIKDGSYVVPLTMGCIALIDAVDYRRVSAFAWHAKKRPDGRFAAACNSTTKRGQETILMHRFLLKLRTKGMPFVDHVNGDSLDNRRINIRIATPSQNCQNRLPNRNKRFKGVRRTANGKWQARISNLGITHYLGVFDRQRDALSAYDERAKALYGAFARPNR